MPPLQFFAENNNIMPRNFEFKAKTVNNEHLENLLLPYHPVLIGMDHQVDTYFNVANGRLKFREGNIENALIHYERTNIAGAKQSNVLLYQHNSDHILKEILEKGLGVKIIVDKQRKIYFIENVKFHFDEVNGLGSFVEVEAIDRDNSLPIERLKEQCNDYAQLFQIGADEFIAESYSDLLLAKISSTS